MTKTVNHVVTRPGRKHGDAAVQIPVADDLTTVPGIRQRDADVSFYSRTYPQETQNIASGTMNSMSRWSTLRRSQAISSLRAHQRARILLTPFGSRLASWALGKLGSPSLIVGIRTPAKNAGSSMSMLSVWHWNKITFRRSPSPVWTLSL